MPDSASGVSTTRSAPNSFCSPSVTRKTPPSAPMSSPISSTVGSASSAAPSPRLIALARVSRCVPAPAVVAGAGTQRLTLAKAINLGLGAALEADPTVLLMGEDIGALGGVFRVTDGLQKEFGADRVVDTPLAESGIVGTAIGLALRGYRPVCE